MAAKVTMRAWKVQKSGIENCQLVDDEPIPDNLGDYEVLIKVLAIGLNPIDYKRAISWPGVTYPFILGLDACGIVEKRGSKVDETRFIENETMILVFGSTDNRVGYFAEYTVHDSRYLSVVPKEIYEGKDLTDVACQLAGLPCAAYTAYQIVFNQLRLFPGEGKTDLRGFKNIVVSAGSGGLGVFCLQFLKLWRDSLKEEERKDVKLIATCSHRNVDYVQKLGATDVVDYTNESIVKRLLELSDGQGVDVFIDNVGFDNRRMGKESLGYGGQFVISVESGDNFGVNELWDKGQSVHSVLILGNYLSKNHDKMEQLRFVGDEVLKLYAEEKIHASIGEILQFENVREGLDKLHQRHVRGKLVARVARLNTIV